MLDCTRREALYGDFIREASKLFVDAFEHDLDDPAKLLHLYAIVSTIRLFGRTRTIEEAERVMTRIGAANFAPTKSCACSATAPGRANSTRFTPSARPAARS